MPTSLDHPSRLVRLPRRTDVRPVLRTDLGQLYQGDCLSLLRAMPDERVDTVFADPPFNLKKDYGPGVSDAMRDEDYVAWCGEWLQECIRVLVPGGTLFVFNLPRWLMEYGPILTANGMTFRHWIAMRMPKTFPRGRRLAPAHYGCLYYTKGAEPKTFNKVYTPIQTCRHCGGEIRDYGGHRNKMNAQGVNMMDVFEMPDDAFVPAESPAPPGEGWTPAEDMWDDIPPVRHGQYKVRGANELAPIMLERLLGVSTNPGDLVFDPFGGAGTTYLAAERLHRRWLGVELGQTAPIVARLEAHARGELRPWEHAARGQLRARRPKRRALTK